MSNLEPIAVDPMMVACMCVSSKRAIPDWVVNVLSGDDLLDARAYNRKLPYLHYHVTQGERKLAFVTEDSAMEFIDKLYYWEGEDDDTPDTTPCYDSLCQVYTVRGMESIGYLIDSKR